MSSNAVPSFLDFFEDTNLSSIDILNLAKVKALKLELAATKIELAFTKDKLAAAEEKLKEHRRIVSERQSRQS